MEALILIPVAAIIYGWLKTFPSITAPGIINGTESAVTFGNGFCDDYVLNEDTLFACDDGGSNEFNEIGTCFGNDIFNDDTNNINCTFLADDMMFNPAYEWCTFNIYHHSDTFNDMGVNDSFNDTFSSGFSDMSSSIQSFID
ncbi:MAG TPA: hypothetical protein HPP97_06930 [Desulfuromonadales bacterium]|nr:hypothetical protein [Desulfuromonadales bacterium]